MRLRTDSLGRDQISRPSSLDSFGALLAPAEGCGRGCSSPLSRPSTVVTRSSPPRSASLRSSSPAVSSRPTATRFCNRMSPASHPRVEKDGGNPGFALAVEQRPGNGGGAPVGGQQRRVEVDGSQRRDGEHRFRQDGKSDDDEQVAAAGGKGFGQSGLGNRFGLQTRQPEVSGGRFDRRGGGPATAAAGTVRVGDDDGDVVSAGRQKAERGNGEFRRSHEQDFHGTSGKLRRKRRRPGGKVTSRRRS